MKSRLSHPLWLRILLAMVLAVTPLSWLAVTQLEHQRQLLDLSAQTTQRVSALASARELLGTALLSLERALRQHAVLKSDESLALVNKQAGHAIRQARQLAEALDRPDTLANSLESLPAMPVEQAIDQLASLNQQRLELNRLSREATREALDQAAERTRIQQHRALTWLAGFLALTLVLVIVLTVGLTAPIQRLIRASRQLDNPDRPPIPGSTIRELSQLAETLEETSARLAVAEKEKLIYLHQVSHALKTPLATLQEGLGVLSEGITGTLKPVQAEVVGLMLASSRDMQRQIENLLVLNRLQMTRDAPQTDQDLHALIGALLRAYTPRLIRRNLWLCLGGPDVKIHASPVQLSGILENLFANLTQYAPAGGHCFIIWRSDADGLTIEFRHEGPAIPADKAHKLFQPFTRGEHAQPQSGSGIGLYVARSLAHLLGGQLTLEPAIADRGVCFRLILPKECVTCP